MKANGEVGIGWKTKLICFWPEAFGPWMDRESLRYQDWYPGIEDLSFQIFPTQAGFNEFNEFNEFNPDGTLVRDTVFSVNFQ